MKEESGKLDRIDKRGLNVTGRWEGRNKREARRQFEQVSD